MSDDELQELLDSEDKRRKQAERIIRLAKQLAACRGHPGLIPGVDDVRVRVGKLCVVVGANETTHVWLRGHRGYVVAEMRCELLWWPPQMDRTLEILNRALVLEALANV